MTSTGRCFRCKGVIEAASGRVGRADACPACGADLKACRNCRRYRPGAHNDCAEPQAERVVDKERANFCEYFALAAADPDEARGKGGMDALKALFGEEG